MTSNTVEAVQAQVAPFFDKDSSTFSYVVKDPDSTACAIVDSVMDFDYASGKTHYAGADEIIAYVKKHNLQVEWILETHVHADHMSAAPYIKEKLGGKMAIGEHIITVQETFGKYFNEGTEFKRDGSQFNKLIKDGDEIMIGDLKLTAFHTPGHTPACMSYLIGDALFVGDTLFMPDGGTARCDFPGGSATTLYDSIQRLLSLPDETRIFMCHDYCPNGRQLEYQTTVADEKNKNIHINSTITREQFIEMRETRDATLDMPRLILPSLQVNMRAGDLPPAEDNQVHYLKIPLNVF